MFSVMARSDWKERRSNLLVKGEIASPLALLGLAMTIYGSQTIDVMAER